MQHDIKPAPRMFKLFDPQVVHDVIMRLKPDSIAVESPQVLYNDCTADRPIGRPTGSIHIHMENTFSRAGGPLLFWISHCEICENLVKP